MNERIQKINRLFAVLLCVLFCGYMLSITCFPHSHIVDGQLVTHSHPYKNTPDNPGHSHTNAQLAFIELLSHFVTSGITFAGLLCLFSGKGIVRYLFYLSSCTQAQIRPYSLRAPPAFRG
jgi:hypothetical protein